MPSCRRRSATERLNDRRSPCYVPRGPQRPNDRPAGRYRVQGRLLSEARLHAVVRPIAPGKSRLSRNESVKHCVCAVFQSAVEVRDFSRIVELKKLRPRNAPFEILFAPACNPPAALCHQHVRRHSGGMRKRRILRRRLPSTSRLPRAHIAGDPFRQ